MNTPKENDMTCDEELYDRETERNRAKAEQERRARFWYPIALVYRPYCFWDDDHEEVQAKYRAPVTEEEMREFDATARNDLEWQFGKTLKELAAGRCPLPDQFKTQKCAWNVALHVLGFGMCYYYSGYVTSEDDFVPQVDILETENALQADYESLFEDFITEGAALAKKVGSASYSTWTQALIALHRVRQSLSHTWLRQDEEDKGNQQRARELGDMLISAQSQLWADLQVLDRLNNGMRPRKDARVTSSGKRHKA